MTKATCKIIYEQAKAKGNQEQMEFWKNRFLRKGGTLQELGIEEIKTKGK